jgi:hypothetical protein
MDGGSCPTLLALIARFRVEHDYDGPLRGPRLEQAFNQWLEQHASKVERWLAKAELTAAVHAGKEEKTP